MIVKSGRPIMSRQAQVLDALVRLGNNKAIARELGISAKAVEAHIRISFQVAGVNERVLLALWWDRQTRKAA